MSQNLRGSVNLLKLEKSCVLTLPGRNGAVKCLCIPIVDNDIYISTDDNGKAKGAYLHVAVNERKEPSERGMTHYIKQTLSKEFKENADEELLKRKNETYLGQLEPFVFDDSNKVNIVDAPIQTIYEPNDDVPF